MNTLKSPINYNASCLFGQTDKPLLLVGIFNMSKEIWKDIPGFEGSYQASNLGNVRSLKRTVLSKDGKIKPIKGGLLKTYIDLRGYLTVTFSVNNKQLKRRNHQLVAMAFLGHKPEAKSRIVIDHIDGGKFNNRVENLQIITHRQNTSKGGLCTKAELKSVGVGRSKNKYKNKFRAGIHPTGQGAINLGNFETEELASDAYQIALKKIMSDEEFCINAKMSHKEWKEYLLT